MENILINPIKYHFHIFILLAFGLSNEIDAQDPDSNSISRFSSLGVNIETPLAWMLGKIYNSPSDAKYSYVSVTYKHGSPFFSYLFSLATTNDYYSRYLLKEKSGAFEVDSFPGHPPSQMTDSTVFYLGRYIKSKNYSLGLGIEYSRPMKQLVFINGFRVDYSIVDVNWTNTGNALIRRSDRSLRLDEFLYQTSQQCIVQDLSISVYTGISIPLSNSFHLSTKLGVTFDSYFGKDIYETDDYYLYKRELDSPTQKIRFYSDITLFYRIPKKRNRTS